MYRNTMIILMLFLACCDQSESNTKSKNKDQIKYEYCQELQVNYYFCVHGDNYEEYLSIEEICKDNNSIECQINTCYVTEFAIERNCEDVYKVFHNCMITNCHNFHIDGYLNCEDQLFDVRACMN